MAGQANELPFADPLGDLHVQRALACRKPPFSVELRHAQCHGPRGSAEGVLEVDEDLGMMILAATVYTCPVPRPNRAAEERGEEIAEVPTEGLAGRAPTELEARVPVGRWVKVLTGLPARPQPIVGGAFLGVLQHLVGLVDLLHALRCIPFLADVGMILARELAVSSLDLALGGRARDAQGLVIVFKLHVLSCPSPAEPTLTLAPGATPFGCASIFYTGMPLAFR